MKKEQLLFVPLVGKTSACRQKEGLKLIKGLPLLPRLAAVLPPQGRKIARGFTLIELLVVVLIISILAAVALSQYQKAVMKSRNAGLKEMIKTVALAEDAYYLIHGQYAANFNELDINLSLSDPKSDGTSTRFGWSGPCYLATMGSNAIKRGTDFDILLNATSLSRGQVVGYWTGGPYKCAGFIMPVSHPPAAGLPARTMYCWEARNGTYKNTKGAFCEKIEKAMSTKVNDLYLN